MQSVDDPTDVSDRTIYVKTKDESIYELGEWEILQNKDIRGKGIRKQPIYGQYYPSVTRFNGILSSGVITEISTEEFDAMGTVVAGIGSIAGIVLLGGCAYVVSWGSWGLDL